MLHRALVALTCYVGLGCYPVPYDIFAELDGDPVVLGPDQPDRRFEVTVCVSPSTRAEVTIEFDASSNIPHELGVFHSGATRDLADTDELGLDGKDCEPMKVIFLVTDPNLASERTIEWRVTATALRYNQKKFEREGVIDIQIVEVD